jgi:hypothetical protein
VLQWAAHLSPQVLAGEGVAQWPFVAAPAACRNGLWPKYRRKCLRHKELENPARSARRSKEFRPRKNIYREGRKEMISRAKAQRGGRILSNSPNGHVISFAPLRLRVRNSDVISADGTRSVPATFLSVMSISG